MPNASVGDACVWHCMLHFCASRSPLASLTIASVNRLSASCECAVLKRPQPHLQFVRFFVLFMSQKNFFIYVYCRFWLDAKLFGNKTLNDSPISGRFGYEFYTFAFTKATLNPIWRQSIRLENIHIWVFERTQPTISFVDVS